MLTWLLSLPWTTQIILSVALVLIAFKLYLYFTTGVCKSKNRLDGKTVLITGANTGIGKETALDLAARGAKVILACRDLQRANKAKSDIIEKTGNTEVLVKQLDLSSLKSVRQFSADILKTEPKIDILINNAGCGLSEKRFTEDGLEYQMASNHFGHFLMTNLLLGLLFKSPNGRIINVSSEGHRLYKSFNLEDINFKSEKSGRGILEIYCASKLANILFTNELANKLCNAGKPVTVNSLHPGAVNTEFGRFVPRFLQVAFEPIARHFAKTSQEGAQTTIYLAVADEVANITGKYFSDCKIAKPSKLSQDAGLAKKLWEVSEQLVGLKPEEQLV